MFLNKEVTCWAYLKAICNELNEEQLSQPVKWWGDERGGKVHKVSFLDEEYSAWSDEGYEPISSYEDETDIEDAKSDPSFMPKDTPVLQVD